LEQLDGIQFIDSRYRLAPYISSSIPNPQRKCPGHSNLGFSFSPILSPRDEAFYFRGFMVLFAIRMERTMVEKKFFRYLKNRPNGTATSLQIIKDLSLKTTYEDFNSIIENLFYRDLILMPHRQTGLPSGLKYDLITISKTGKKFIQN
jgi:hypothetical protein